MPEVKLLDIGETEQDIFTRWDITGHQVNNRIDIFFNPDHAGWFTSVQAAQDVTLFLHLAKSSGAPLRSPWPRATPTGKWPTTDGGPKTSPPSSNTASV